MTETQTAQQKAAALMLLWHETTPHREGDPPIPHYAILRLTEMIARELDDARRSGWDARGKADAAVAADPKHGLSAFRARENIRAAILALPYDKEGT